MKRKVLIIALIIVLLAGFVYFVPVPIPVNKTLDGILWQEEEGPLQTQKRTVEVKGTYYLYLFKNDHFSGKISISGKEFLYTVSSRSKMMDMSISEEGVAYPSFNWYDPGMNQGRHESLGLLYIDGIMEKLYFEMDEGYLAVPAANRDEAIQIVERIK